MVTATVLDLIPHAVAPGYATDFDAIRDCYVNATGTLVHLPARTGPTAVPVTAPDA